MKLRHKAELKALQSQPAKGIGAKKKQKDDEKLMQQRHDAELRALEQQPSSTADPATTAAADTAVPAEPAAATTAAAAADGTPHTEAKDDDARSGNKPSRAQQKRDKRLQKDKQRQVELAAELADMADPRADENAKLRQRLTPRRLSVKEMISDGHCLFRAVSHQLSLLQPPPLPIDDSSHTALRLAASGYMERHMHSFLPYLVRDDDGEMMTAQEAAEYVRALRREQGDVVWGGHAECVALSGVLGRPLHVWSADGGEMVVTGVEGGGGGEDGTGRDGQAADGHDVQISFHKYYFGLGNHYNSVVPVTVEHDDDDDQS